MADQDKLGKKLASLEFRIAASYFWPFSGGKFYKFRGLKETFRDAVEGAKKLARYTAVLAGAVAAHQIIQPATGMLFPSGEDFMRENGLDPALARQLSDHEVHIRGRDFIGKAHAMMDIPTVIGMIIGTVPVSMDNNAFAFRGLPVPFSDAYTYDLTNQCNVILLPEETTVKGLVSAMTDIPEEDIERVSMSLRETRIAVAFHEFAHCDTQNRLESPLFEADADARGIWLAAQALDNPEIIRTFIYMRAMSTGAHDHDVALYLDAKYRGVELPSAWEMPGPTTDAFDLARMYEDRFLDYSDGPYYLRKALALQGVLREHGALLSESGKRRAELYIEAVRYFVPSTAKKLDYQSTVSVPAAPALTQ